MESSEQIPAAGNQQNGINESARKKMEANKEIRDRAIKEESKFFSLEIGEEALVHIDIEKTKPFEGKTRDGDLQTQFRYFITDPNTGRLKTWDTYAKQSEAIDEQILKDGTGLILIRCHRGKNGGKNYLPYNRDELGQNWEVDIK